MLLGLALRLGAYAFVGESRIVADEREYKAHAVALVEGRQFLDEGKRPPGSIWFYAGFAKLTGLRGQEMRLANVLAGTFLVALVWLLAKRVGGLRTAAWAAFACAAYPALILYDVSFWSESLYACLVTGALVLLAGRGHAPALLGAGVLMGAAALTREVGAVLPLLGTAVVPFAAVSRRARVVRAAVLVAGFVVVVAPWSIRQNRGEESFALISRTTWLNLYIGNAPPPEEVENVRRGGSHRMPNAYEALGPDRPARDAEAKRIVLQAVRDRMPWWPFEKIGETFPDLLTPAPLPVARLRHRTEEPGWPSRWAYTTPVDGTSVEWLRDALSWGVVVAWIATALAGTAGLGLALGRPGILLLVLAVVLQSVPVVVTFAASRFRLPMIPVLLVGAAWLVVHGREAWRAAGTARRLGVGASVVALTWIIASGWRELVDPRWN